MKKEIIILTKSVKHGGFCVAGLDRSSGEWVRLVSGNEANEHSVSQRDMCYENGYEIEIFDIVEVDIIKHYPSNVQKENYLYNENATWKKKGVSNLQEVVNLHGYDTPKFIFGNEDIKLTDENISLTNKSLLLVHIENAQYFIKTFPEGKKIQLNFRYNGTRYSYIRVTQKDLLQFFSDKTDGFYDANEEVFVFSLTDKYEKTGKYYKVMAQALG
ncbi:MAG: hypothetical protein NC223_02055 [Butyrivibrio sp.]|nr:hypothetical protein [Butyrivibrio sp.]